MTFNPYKLAAEEEKRQGEVPLKIAKKGAILAGTLALGGSQILRLLPFLSKYIPEKIAKTGMKKIIPKTEKFFNETEKAGYSFDDARQFIRGKLNPLIEEEEAKKPKSSQEAMTMNIAKAKSRRQPSELSRESLMEQRGMSLNEPSANTGKAALLQTMQEITEALRRMRGNG